VQPDNLDEIEYVEWGSVLEEPIAKKYVSVTKRLLIDHGRHDFRISTDYPWMGCTIDREIFPIEGHEGPGDLSIKNAGEFKRRDWEDEPPLPYQVQLQHELAVTGWQWGSFAVLIGGNKFHWCDVERNDSFISALVEQEEAFLDRVKRGDPPPADASDSAKHVLSKLYAKDTGESVRLADECLRWADEWRSAKKCIVEYEKSKQLAENKLKEAIGNASIGILPDGTAISWKLQHRSAYTVDACDFRVLREIKIKK
jgi:predicted phage-related endonuclease